VSRGLTARQKAAADRVASRPDAEVDQVETVLRASERLVPAVRVSIREGIDELLDGRRTQRVAYADLTRSERSYCGVRIESILTRHLELPPGVVLDVAVAEIDVDIKVSATGRWMIAPAQLGGVVLLIQFAEATQSFSVGVARAHREFMNPSNTRDAKRSFSAYAKRYIRWLATDETLPVSVLQRLDRAALLHIFEASARAERLRRCLEHIPAYLPFPRSIIETVVGGDDPLRGVRADATRFRGRHPLGAVRVLSYQRNGWVRALGFPPLAKREHMKVPASDLTGFA
jgi:hypothetical protein